MKLILSLSRWLVGLLFILSGFVKMDDPLGFAYKLEEYFSPFVLDLEFLTPLALPISVFVVILEILLGVALIIGYKPKLTTYTMTGLITFFTFLTFYSAYFNKVQDCGCFGDALKLTPWGTFTKDVVLLLFCVLFLFRLNAITPLLNSKINRNIMLLSTLSCTLFTFWVLRYLPVIDFRPYKIGNNIKQLMEIPPDASPPVFEYNWRFKLASGEEKVITTSGGYPSVEGQFLDVKTNMIDEGYKPPIKDFSMLKDGVDYAETFLSEEKLILIISSDPTKLADSQLEKLKQTTFKLKNEGYKVIALFPAQMDIDWIDIYLCDAITLKTIVRSNPGMLKLGKGTILDKQPWRHMDHITTN